jgi:hypothetical protein
VSRSLNVKILFRERVGLWCYSICKSRVRWQCSCLQYMSYMACFHIALVISTRPWYRPESFNPRDDISRGLMTRAIWKRPCINLFITYFARADNMLLPFTRGQITCDCPRKMLLPRRQITRRKCDIISFVEFVEWISKDMEEARSCCCDVPLLKCRNINTTFLSR